jgi:quercetin dioxygenase-like cupin family protein
MLSRMTTRVSGDSGAPGDHWLAAPIDSSPLSLGVSRLESGKNSAVISTEHDTLLFAFDGSGSLVVDEAHELHRDTASLVLAGETGTVSAGVDGLSLVRVAVAASTDLHAPMGPRDVVVQREQVEKGAATGSRSFQVLFGPHNGSTRATMFVGYIPPGKAPWHYHLYDEIVWVVGGAGRLHIEDVEELSAGSAFRLRPLEVHIVENTSADEELAVLGIFTPAGSPSAAYLEPGVAAEYRIG